MSRLASWSAYWSAVLLAVAAVVLLVVGAAHHGGARTVLLSVGSALLGATLTRAVDLVNEHRADAARAAERRERDLDETRRVAYMAMLANRAQAPELVPTIVNALAHHGLGTDPALAADHLINLVDRMPVNRPASERWLQDQIDEINRQLGQ